MRLPIDTRPLQFLVVAAEEDRKYEKDKPREQWERQVDENGQLLYRVQVVVMSDRQAEVVRVHVAGDPGVKQGEVVAVDGLTATTWERDGKSGVKFRADAIRSAHAAKQAA